MPSLDIINSKAADPKAKAAEVTIRDFSAVIPQTSAAVKAKALATAGKIKKIDSDEQLAVAVDALRPIKAIIKEVALTRKTLAAPFDEICKDLRAKEQAFLKEVEEERQRLVGVMNNWEQRKLREAEEKSKAIAAQAAQVERQAQTKVEQARELETLAKGKKGAAAKALMDKAAALYLEAEEEALGMPDTSLVIPTPSKVAGYSAKQVIDFEVTDAIIFCQAFPQFFKWNADTENLKLMRAELKEVLNTPKNIFVTTRFPEELPDNPEGLPKPPGLKVFYTMRGRSS